MNVDCIHKTYRHFLRFLLALCSLVCTSVDILAQQDIWHHVHPLDGRHTNAIATRPDGIIILGTSNDGIYFSHDDGNTWDYPYSGVQYSSQYSTTITPKGDLFVGGMVGTGSRSTDNGKSWTNIHIGPENMGYSIPQISYDSKGNLFAYTTQGILYRSIDNGDSWQSISSSFTPESVTAFTIDSKDRIIVGNSADVKVSTDAGNSWQTISSPFNFGFPQNMAVTHSNEIFVSQYDKGISHSTDGGVTWNKLTNFPLPSVRSIMISRGNIYVIADSINFGVTGVFRSTDNGISWSRFDDHLENVYTYSIGADSLGGILMSVQPNIQGTNEYDCQLIRTTDDGKSWKKLNNGLTIRSIMAMGSDSSGVVYAGTEGGEVSRTTDKGANWSQTKVRSGIYVNSIVSTPGGVVVAARNKGGLIRSTDHGITWSKITNGIKDSAFIRARINYLGEIFAYSSEGFRATYSSVDNGESWTTIPSLPIVDPGTIVRTQNNRLLGIGGSHIYHSEDNGASWKVFSDSAISKVDVTYIWVSPTDHYYGWANYYHGGMVRSSDKGVTWERMFTFPVYGLNQDGKGNIFVSTDSGIYISKNDGDSWELTKSGLHNSKAGTWMTTDKDGFVYLMTNDYGFGRMFRTTESGTTDVTQRSNSVAQNSIVRSIYPNPSGGTSRILLQLPKHDKLRISLQDSKGAILETIFDGYLEAGEQEIVMTLFQYGSSQIASGGYFLRFEYEGRIELTPFILHK
jgi:photosystem II stability/assembly factor-like uncharacterized protein